MKRNQILLLIVPLLMVLFFIRNIVLVETDNMDSWMGGGMRMFGKVDKMLYRVAGMKVNYNGKEYFVNYRNIGALEDDDVALRILPNDDRLNEMYQKAKTLKWCYDKVNDEIVLQGDNCSIPIEKLDVQSLDVYRTDFNDADNLVSLKLINSSKNDQ